MADHPTDGYRRYRVRELVTISTDGRSELNAGDPCELDRSEYTWFRVGEVRP
jgi:hypothetical protein